MLVQLLSHLAVLSKFIGELFISRLECVESLVFANYEAFERCELPLDLLLVILLVSLPLLVLFLQVSCLLLHLFLKLLHLLLPLS